MIDTLLETFREWHASDPGGYAGTYDAAVIATLALVAPVWLIPSIVFHSGGWRTFFWPIPHLFTIAAKPLEYLADGLLKTRKAPKSPVTLAGIPVYTDPHCITGNAYVVSSYSDGECIITWGDTPPVRTEPAPSEPVVQDARHVAAAFAESAGKPMVNDLERRIAALEADPVRERTHPMVGQVWEFDHTALARIVAVTGEGDKQVVFYEYSFDGGETWPDGDGEQWRWWVSRTAKRRKDLESGA